MNGMQLSSGSYTHIMGGGANMGMMHPNLFRTIQHCAGTCDHMITHLLHHEDTNMRRKQLELLIDCAKICHLTASLVASESHMSRMMAHVCAHICELCANECAKFPDQHSQHCAQVCRHCAQECRAFAGM